MDKRDLICITCPLGCMVHVEAEDGIIKNISGNTCKRGEIYAKKEITNPTRIVTSTVKVLNGMENRVPVKTKEDIPKDKIKECMEAIRSCTVIAPVYLGEVIIENAAGTNVNIVATKNVKKNMLTSRPQIGCGIPQQ